MGFRVDVKWDDRGFEDLASRAIEHLTLEIAHRVSSVTCPTHHRSHRVTWAVGGDQIVGSVASPCCERVKEQLDAAARRALR